MNAKLNAMEEKSGRHGVSTSAGRHQGGVQEPSLSKQLLTVKEAAARLALTEATIRAWIGQRRLPVVRCGRAIRVPSESIEEFICRNTVPARENR
jgi:excisionase family DNA binding protein